MSDAEGTGYGSSHDWKRDITDKFMFRGREEIATRYICRRCKRVFIHHYHVHPGIFEEMEYQGIPDTCPGLPHPEGASWKKSD